MSPLADGPVADAQRLSHVAYRFGAPLDEQASTAGGGAVGLDEKTLARFDADAQRRNYLLLQENLCDLGRGARRRLGEALRSASTEPSGRVLDLKPATVEGLRY